MATSAWTVFGNVIINNAQAVQGLQTIRNQARTLVDNLKSNFSGIQGAVNQAFGAGLFTGVRELGSNLINATGEMQNFRASLLAVTKNGQEADQLFAKLNAFEAKTPFQLPEVVKAGIQFRVMGQEVEKNLLLAGELSTAFNTDLNTAVLAVSKSMAGLPEGLESMRNTFGFTQQEMKKLGVSFDNSGQIIIKTKNDMNILREAVSKFVEQSTHLQAMENRSKTLQGQFSNLSSEVFRTAAAFGDQLAPAMSYVTGIGMKMLVWLQNTSPEFKTAAVGTIGFLGILGGLAALSGPIGILGGVISGVAGIFGTMATTTVTLGGAFFAAEASVYAVDMAFTKFMKVLTPAVGPLLLLVGAWKLLLEPCLQATQATDQATQMQEAFIATAEKGKDVFGRYANQIGKTAWQLNQMGVTSKSISNDILDLQAQMNALGGKDEDGNDIEADPREKERILALIAERKKARSELMGVEKQKASGVNVEGGRSSGDIQKEIAEIEHLGKVDKITREEQLRRLKRISVEISNQPELLQMQQQVEEKIYDLDKAGNEKKIALLKQAREAEEASSIVSLGRRKYYIDEELKLINTNTEEGRARAQDLRTERQALLKQQVQDNIEASREYLKIGKSDTRQRLQELQKEVNDYRRAGVDKTLIEQIETKKRQKIWQDEFRTKKIAQDQLNTDNIKTQLETSSSRVQALNYKKGMGVDVDKDMTNELKNQLKLKQDEIRGKAQSEIDQIPVLDPLKKEKILQIRLNEKVELQATSEDYGRQAQDIVRNRAKDQAQLKLGGLELQQKTLETKVEQRNRQIALGDVSLKSNMQDIQDLKDKFAIEEKILIQKADIEKVDKSIGEQTLIEKNLQIDILGLHNKKIDAVRALKAEQKDAQKKADKEKADKKAEFYDTPVFGSLEDLADKEKKENEARQAKMDEDEKNKELAVQRGIEYNDAQRAKNIAIKGIVVSDADEMRKQINQNERKNNALRNEANKEEIPASNELKITFVNPDGTTNGMVLSDDPNLQSTVKNYTVPPTRRGSA